jgi:hypothetical protein
MGLSSFNCKRCGESLKAPYELPVSMAWQNRVVAVTPEGQRIAGFYDGYGRVNLDAPMMDSWGYQIPTVGPLYHAQAALWHERCAPVRPLIYLYSRKTPPCQDQGYWYDRPPEDNLLNRPFQLEDGRGRVDTSLVDEQTVADSLWASTQEQEQHG